MKKLKILAIGQGCYVPSYKFRLEEVKKDFINKNIDYKAMCFSISSYPPQGIVNRLWWIIKIFVNRYPVIRLQKKTDILILQREMISTLYTLERFLSKPFIFDIDDAIHLNQRFNAINKIAVKAKAIVVCNRYLADYYKNYNKNVYVIPTPVNTKKYKPKYQLSINSDTIVIGWIGTSSNFVSLRLIEEALATILKKHPNVVLKVVSDKDPKFSKIDPKQYIFKQWSAKEDAEDIQSFDIGIMPLINNEHSRGKCAFKMLQYMACGIPVVSTCLPMNQQILSIRESGFCVDGYDSQWVKSLDYLIHNSEERRILGENGRKVVESQFSSEIYVQKYIDIFSKIEKGII